MSIQRERDLGSALRRLGPVLPEASKHIAADLVRHIASRRNGENRQPNHNGRELSLSKAQQDLEAGYYGGLEDARAATGETLRGVEYGINNRPPDPRFNMNHNGKRG